MINFKEKLNNLFNRKGVTQYSDVILINEEGKILILLRSNSDKFEPGKFSLPGGHIDKGETPIASAARELSEEVAIDLDVSELSEFKTVKKKSSVIHYFLASVNSNGVKIILDNDEHQGYEWLDIEDISKRDFLLDLGDFLLDCFDVKQNISHSSDNLLSLTDKINKAEDILNESLNKGLDDDIYLEKINELKIIKSNLQKKIVTRISYSGDEYYVKINNILKSEEIEDEIDFSDEYNNSLDKSFYYKDKLYDEYGIGLPYTSEQISKILSSNSNVFTVDEDLLNNSVKTFEETDRYRFEILLPTVNKYNELFDKYLLEIEENFNSSKLNFKARRSEIKKSLKEYFNGITSNEDILNILDYIRNNFNENLDVSLIVKFKQEDKRSRQVYLSELDEYLKNTEEELNLKQIDIQFLDSFEDMEFKMEYFNPDNSLVISTISNKIREKLSKTIERNKELSNSLDEGEINDDEFLNLFMKSEDPSKGGTLVQKKITDKTGKQTTKWVSKEDLPSIKEQGKKNDNELVEFAKNSSLQDLESTIKESSDQKLREIAHKEINRRGKEESVQEEKVDVKKSEDIEILDEPKVEILKGCLMFYPNIDLAKWKGKVQSLIREDVVQEFEFEPHITILYGLDDSKINVSDLKVFVQDYIKENPLSFTADEIGVFSNDRDVIKLDVVDLNGNLTKLNQLIKENFEYENDYPDYLPHITICYANKGVGSYFDGWEINPVDFGFDNIKEITQGNIIYSNSNKEHLLIHESLDIYEYN